MKARMIAAWVGAVVLVVGGSVFAHRAWGALQIRKALLEAMRPVRLSNCAMKRFGAVNDGGYMLCENLAAEAQAAYSYGIDGRDEWGCDVWRAFHLPVQQYDCFDPQRPVCEGAQFVFHDECIDAAAHTDEGRPYDTLEAQIAKNGDAGKRLLVKMDVEGAEWDVFASAPDAVLERIDQLAVEFHGVDEERFARTMERLGKTFFVVDLHYNNFTCRRTRWPLPAKAFELLLVNKRIGQRDASSPAVATENPAQAKNWKERPDCQSYRLW